MLTDLLDVPSWQLALVIFTIGSIAYYVNSQLQVRIPAVQAGTLPGISNATAYGDDPITFLTESRKKHGSIFKANMIFNSTYWLLDKQLNKVYLSMKEDVWSFSDGMVRLSFAKLYMR